MPPAHASPRVRPRARTRVCALLCALAMLAPPASLPARAQINLPALGDSATDDFNVGTERKVGDQIMREVRRDPDYLDDPLLLEYLQSLWQPLLSQARASGNIAADIDQRFAWEAFLVRDRSVNAFALPGGFVGVHLGLMAMTATRDELASVLAHELSHVTQRHIARSITNSQRQSLASAVALVLGVLAASRARNADMANAAIAGSQAAAIQGQLNFSRDMEREADRIGLAMLSSAGFAPGGMAAMFEKLDQSSRLNDSGGYPYLRSHPLNTERIGEARSRVDPSRAGATGNLHEHRLAQARARVLMDTRADALRRWQALDGDRTSSQLGDQLASAYSSALASTLLRDWARADASLVHAQELLRGKERAELRAARALQLLAVQSMLARGDAQRAANLLRPLADDASRPVMVLGAQVAVAAASGNAAERDGLGRLLKHSADELQTWVATQPRDALAWALLGQTWAALNQPLRSLRADAESRLALGDMNGAIDRLIAAQRQSRSAASPDFIEASVVDSRLRDLEGMRRRQYEEERAAR
ncbi:MAG: M48 family metalloprotease [Rhizobacter sp.]|nr:M48 family metalloprotease [Rhizobacter sp.]